MADDPAITDGPAPESEPQEAGAGAAGFPPPVGSRFPPGEDDWKQGRTGRQYINPSGKKGPASVIYRRGDETIAQAIARDRAEREQAARDKRPRPHAKRPKMPPALTSVDLKELEQTLAEALKAPAMVCATFGDEWAAEHFTRSGPYLARNLIMASEHNPWLRRKLEEAATGEDAMMMVVSLVGVGGALFAYVIPPIIYWFNLPAPPKTREMFGIPPRKHQQPAPYAADQPPEPAETFPEPAQAA
jgi:hypothetical protein